MSLTEQGWLNIPSGIGMDLLENLRKTVFCSDRAGTRCLMDHPLVRETAILIREHLVSLGHLEPGALAIQAIAFDKTPATNWKVAWHQDLMFPTACPATSPGYTLACEKDGVPFARPPVGVLAALTAVRLSLDPCGPENGPLRVAPGTHRHGTLNSGEITDHIAREGETVCTNAEGDLLLMKPLLLHASSQATSPGHRRVLHFVYHNGSSVSEPWHRAV